MPLDVSLDHDPYNNIGAVIHDYTPGVDHLEFSSGDQATNGGEHLVHDGGDIWSMRYIGVDDQEHASSYDIVGSSGYDHIDWNFA